MKKIVIIGATGYVGSAILKEALGRGHQVKAIVRNPSKLTLIHPNLKVVGGNVTDTDFLSRELAKSEAVISAFNPGWENPKIYDETLEGYGSIICAVRNAGVHRYLMVGGAGSLLVAPGRLLMNLMCRRNCFLVSGAWRKFILTCCCRKSRSTGSS